MFKRYRAMPTDLPTDAQWEYACRAGKGTPINTGLKSPNNASWNEVAWSSENAKSYQPVGSKQSNSWGLYDMHGNILEICLDWASNDESKYHATFQEGWQDGAVTTNPVGVAFSAVSTESALRVIKRGGSYKHDTSYLPSGYHMTGGLKYEDDYIGCRLVCPLSDVVDLMKCDNIVEEGEQ